MCFEYIFLENDPDVPLNGIHADEASLSSFVLVGLGFKGCRSSVATAASQSTKGDHGASDDTLSRKHAAVRRHVPRYHHPGVDQHRSRNSVELVGCLLTHTRLLDATTGSVKQMRSLSAGM